MSEKIKVLVSVSDNFGISLYRVKECHIKLQELYPDEFEIDLVNAPMINWNDINFLKQYHIVFAHRQFVDFQHMETLVSELKKHNVITILDVDDYWDLDPSHPIYHIAKSEEMAKKTLDNIKKVDYVTTTTPNYQSYIKPFNKNVFVFENGVDDSLKQYKFKEKEKSDFTRILWAGGSSHLPDISLLTDSFDKMRCDQQLKDKYQLHLVGFDLRGSTTSMELNPEFVKELQSIGFPLNQNFVKVMENVGFDLTKIPSMPKNIVEKYNGNVVNKTTRDILPKESVWYNYEKIFTSDYKLIKDEAYVDFLGKFKIDEAYPNQFKEQPYIRHKTQSIYTFANNYRHGDVALAPIRIKGKVKDGVFEDNILNRYQFAKSNLKIIEAGIHKVPVIASNIPTYNFDKDFVDGKNIIYVKPERQEKDWYDKMKKLILNPNLIEDLGEAAYEVIMKKYHQNVLAEKRRDFYKEIVSRHNK